MKCTTGRLSTAQNGHEARKKNHPRHDLHMVGNPRQIPVMGSPGQPAPRGRLGCRRADEASPPVPFQPLVCRSLPQSAAACRPHGSGCDHGCSSLSAMSTSSCLVLGPPAYRPAEANVRTRWYKPWTAVRMKPSFQSWKCPPTWTLTKGGGGGCHQVGFMSGAALLGFALSSVLCIIIETLLLVPPVLHVLPAR